MATKLANPQIDRNALSSEKPLRGSIIAAGQFFEIAKSVHFEAAHRLPSEGGDEPHGRFRGHSFELEVTISGIIQPGKRSVADLDVLTAALDEIANELDHQLLNDVDGLLEPTLENILIWVANRLSNRFEGLSKLKLSRPSLKEVCVLRLAKA